LLSRGIGSPDPSARAASVGSPSNKSKASPGKAKPVYEGASYVVTVESARKAGKIMTVVAAVRNATDKELSDLRTSRPSMGDLWKLVDEEGEVWQASRGEVLYQTDPRVQDRRSRHRDGVQSWWLPVGPLVRRSTSATRRRSGGHRNHLDAEIGRETPT
jgi:hypothetical protein